MELLAQILFYSHLLGFAAVAGGLMAQLTSKTHKITGVILNGARWQITSGIFLVAIEPDEFNMTAVAVKLSIVLVILAICEALRKKAVISNKIYWLLVALVVIETAVALFVAKEVPTVIIS